MARKSSTKKKRAVKRQPRRSESAEPAQKNSTDPRKISKAELKKILGARRKWARDWLGIFVLATAFWLLLFLVTTMNTMDDAVTERSLLTALGVPENIQGEIIAGTIRLLVFEQAAHMDWDWLLSFKELVTGKAN